MLFTDESMVRKSQPGTCRVLQKKGERCHPRTIETSTGRMQVGAMVWAGFMGRRKGPLLHLGGGRINTLRYVEMVETHVLEWFRRQEGAHCLHDNATVHTSRQARAAFREFGIEPIGWPARLRT